MLAYLYKLATDKYKGAAYRPAKAFLLILSFIYGWVVQAVVLFYRARPYRLDCKVVSVGNITLGGTGKTVLVEYAARYLRQEGHKVAILSRGYKRSSNPKSQIPKSDYQAMGDEPYMLSQKLGDIPVIVDADRARSAKKAIKDYSADTVILDDGFQQWRIKKDLEIVVIDSVNPFGNRHLLPRGVLREPLSCLERADVFILTKTNLNPVAYGIKDLLYRANPQALVVESMHQPAGFYDFTQPQHLITCGALSGKTVALFCGIGDPDSFENLAAGLGVKIGLSFRFCDHYAYTQKDLERIMEESRKKGIDTVLTTEKDAVRLYELGVRSYELRVLVLRIELKIAQNDEEKFHNRLLRVYTA